MRLTKFACAWALAAALFHQAPAAEIVITAAPSSVVPSAPVEIAFDYTRLSPVEEKRVVFLCELFNASTDELIHRAVLNNGNAGYAQTEGSLSANFTAPPTANGVVYARVTATPWSMNRALVAKLESYPTDGTFTYEWVISRSGDYGVTQNVVYLGLTVCPDYPGNTTYCSGVAFEAFIIGWNEYNAQHGHSAIPGLTTGNINAFRRVWYGITDAEKLSARAIPEYGIGLEITDFEEFQKGDSMQLWRTSGSGHNPVFINWVRNTAGDITGVRYWGSQGGSNGIGYRTEYFSDSGGSVRRDRIYAARARKPRDQADYDWALGSASTKGDPTPAEQWGLF